MFSSDAHRRISKAVRDNERRKEPVSARAAAPRTPDGKIWYYTTGAISSASVSGSSVSNAVLTLGSGTARRCIPGPVSSGGGPTKIPDPNRADETIYSGAVLATSSTTIAAGNFFQCHVVNGKMEIDFSAKCT